MIVFCFTVSEGESGGSHGFPNKFVVSECGRFAKKESLRVGISIRTGALRSGLVKGSGNHYCIAVQVFIVIVIVIVILTVLFLLYL